MLLPPKKVRVKEMEKEGEREKRKEKKNFSDDKTKGQTDTQTKGISVFPQPFPRIIDGKQDVRKKFSIKKFLIKASRNWFLEEERKRERKHSRVGERSCFFISCRIRYLLVGSEKRRKRSIEESVFFSFR